MIEYRPHFIPSAVYVVGCGGTGSRLVPLLGQLVRTTMRDFNPQGWILSLPIFLIDNDIVEQKNLLRQNFIQQDVDKHKAVVLANRYSRAFEIQMYPCTQRIDSMTHALEFLGLPPTQQRSNQNVILILAVDSAQARREVLSYFNRNFNNIFTIDAGNEDTFGQVRFFTDCLLGGPDGRKDIDPQEKIFFSSLPKMVPAVYQTDYIPYPSEHYNNLGSSASEKSCADLDQTLAINAMMATMMASVVQNFLYIKPMNYHEITYNLNGAISTTFNTPENWFKRGRTISRYPQSLNRSRSMQYGLYESLTDEAFKYRQFLVQSFRNMNVLLKENGELEALPAPEVKPETKAVKKAAPKKKVTAEIVHESDDEPF